MCRHFRNSGTLISISVMIFQQFGFSQTSEGNPTVEQLGRTSIEAGSIFSFPLGSNYYESSTYTILPGVGKVLTSRQTVYRRPSISASVSARHRVYGTPIGSKGWNLNLELGITFRVLRFNTDETEFSFCPNCTFISPAIDRVFTREALQLGFLVDNILILSNQFKRLNLAIGINIQTGYAFYSKDVLSGSELISQRRMDDYNQTITSFSYPNKSSIENWLSVNHSARFMVRLAPTALRGVYIGAELPLHQSIVDGTGGLYSYSFSFSIGYRIQQRISK